MAPTTCSHAMCVDIQGIRTMLTVKPVTRILHEFVSFRTIKSIGTVTLITLNTSRAPLVELEHGVSHYCKIHSREPTGVKNDSATNLARAFNCSSSVLQ